MIGWEAAARENAWLQWWATASSRSIFSGDTLGALDICYALMAAVAVGFLMSFSGKIGARWLFLRTWSVYCLACMLCFFVVNRGMKVVFARVRPSDVLRGDFDFTPMWLIGQYDLLDALSKGSFTSGHTTTAMALLPLAFLALGSGSRVISFPLFIMAIGWGLLVGWGRVINGSHYPSDILWAVIVCIWICAFVHDHLLQPHRLSLVCVTFFQDLRLTLWFGLGVFLFFVVLAGTKEAVFGFSWWWTATTGFGAFGVWFSVRRVGVIRLGRGRPSICQSEDALLKN